ncbi:MAG: cytochrome c oxidase assembly protein [Candidatus Binataceae bacterium]|nr:cytochrome c oxidase assembly protein [Candidatus Binataceae bacterium]
MHEFSISVILGVAALAGLYLAASLLLDRRPARRQTAAFGLGLAMMTFALTGPIDHYVQARSFALYIFQQMLLVFIVPPLLLIGMPDWMARPLLVGGWFERAWRILTRPLVAFLIFSSTFTLIHYPLLCDHVCHARLPYGDIRELLLLVGLLLWWPLLSPLPEYPRLSYPMQIMYLFLLMIPMTAVAAPITMAQTVLYMFYASGPHPFGITPQADQVLGGLIMWIGQGIYLMCVFTAIFFRWSRFEDREVPAINLRLQPGLRVIRRPAA